MFRFIVTGVKSLLWPTAVTIWHSKSQVSHCDWTIIALLHVLMHTKYELLILNMTFNGLMLLSNLLWMLAF